MKTILFVCTGNTCRSPMAQVLFEKLLKDSSIGDVKVMSAGFAAESGAPASRGAMEAVAEVGADLSFHRSRPVTEELVEESDAVYTMTSSHASLLKAAFPDAAGKIHVLGGGISDPFGGDAEVYRRCRDSILAALKTIIEQVK